MNCYSLELLREFALGKVDEGRAQEMEQHLQICPSCEETIASLDEATDSLVRELKQPVVAASSYATDVGFLRALHSVQSDPFRSDGSDVAQVRDSVAASAATPSVWPPAPDNGMSQDEPRRFRDYELIEPLGQGGMGMVYRAVHLRLQRQVALKLLPERRLRDPLAVVRFQREMQAIGQMDHPAIVRAMDAGEVAGHHYLAMELIDGVDLGRLVRSYGPLPWNAACELIRQAAAGLEYVHARQMIHRDLKPSNLMLDRHGHVKVLDLGLALLDGVHGIPDELTTVGQLMGTLDYMAPEQFQDSHDVDRRADVYGLAATLYALLTGHAPYATPPNGAVANRSPLQKLKAIATEPVPPLLSRRPEIPSELAAVVHHGLEHDPQRRPTSARAWAEELTRWADPQALTPLVDSIGAIQAAAAAEWRRRSPVAVTGAPSFHLPTPTAGSTAQSGAVDVRLAGSLPLGRAAASVDSVASASNGGPIASASRGAGRARWWTVLLGAGGLGLVLAGWVVFVQTDRGELIINSPVDNVEVVLTRNGQSLESKSLDEGQNRLAIRAGDYTLTIVGNVQGYRVEPSDVQVARGSQQVAAVVIDTHRATDVSRNAAAEDFLGEGLGRTPAEDSVTESPMATYQQQTLDAWLSKARVYDEFRARNSVGVEILTAIRRLSLAADPKARKAHFDRWLIRCQQEIAADRLSANLAVLNALGVVELAPQAVKQTLLVLRQRDWPEPTQDNEWIYLAAEVVQTLQKSSAADLDLIWDAELKEGNSLTRAIVLGIPEIFPGVTTLDAERFLDGILMASRDPDPLVARAALQSLGRIARTHPVAKERLEEAMNDLRLQYDAAQLLFVAEGHPVAYPELQQMVSDSNPRTVVLGLAGWMRWRLEAPELDESFEDIRQTDEGRNRSPDERSRDDLTLEMLGEKLDEPTWGQADAARPAWYPRGWAILALARQFDWQEANRYFDRDLASRADQVEWRRALDQILRENEALNVHRREGSGAGMGGGFF